MSNEDMRRLAELAQDFYAEQQVKSGMTEPIRKAWAANEDEGLLLIVSVFGAHSRDLAKQTGIPWKGSQEESYDCLSARMVKLHHALTVVGCRGFHNTKQG